VIVGVAVVAALVQLAVALTTAPANWDSMTYHLSRAAYWLQDGVWGPYEGASIRQLASAPNAELALAWTMALGESDAYVGLVQWVALGGAAGAVWMVARELGFQRPAATLAAATFAVLPSLIAQSATTQNDLVVAACLMVGIAFGLAGLRRWHGPMLALAGVAFGLGVGTKGTMLFALPGDRVRYLRRAHPDPRAGPVWDLTRAQEMSGNRPGHSGYIQAIEDTFPAGSRLAFMGGEDSWDYPLFGARRPAPGASVTSPDSRPGRRPRRRRASAAGGSACSPGAISTGSWWPTPRARPCSRPPSSPAASRPPATS
jgi:hypothetical protein